MRTTSVTVMVTFFESSILKVTWSQLCSKSFLKKCKAHWQKHFERYPIVFYFTDMDQHACMFCFIKTSVNVTETRIDEGTQNVHLKEHCPKMEITFHSVFALLFLTNLVFKFNIVFIDIFFLRNANQNLYQLSLSLSSALCFFVRNSKILMRLTVLIFKVFSFKILKPYSYFFMKNAYLVRWKLFLMLKIVFMLCKNWGILCMIDTPSGAWLICYDWFSMYISGYSFVSKNINNCYFNFLCLNFPSQNVLNVLFFPNFSNKFY